MKQILIAILLLVICLNLSADDIKALSDVFLNKDVEILYDGGSGAQQKSGILTAVLEKGILLEVNKTEIYYFNLDFIVRIKMIKK
jgi:hypothetical protein